MMTRRQSEITVETIAAPLCSHHGGITGHRTQVGSVGGLLLGGCGSLVVQ
jgi:hypothetical protein